MFIINYRRSLNFMVGSVQFQITVIVVWVAAFANYFTPFDARKSARFVTLNYFSNYDVGMESLRGHIMSNKKRIYILD